MTPEAKKALSTTIRALRARLLGQDLPAATETAYRTSVGIRAAGLSEAGRAKRRRLEGWIAEQRRAEAGSRQKQKLQGKKRKKKKKVAEKQELRSAEDFLREVQKQAGYTLLNRLVILRIMEAGERPLRLAPILSGGWESRAYKDFRELARSLVRSKKDETEGYAFLLQLVFEDLATELPGLFGAGGVADLIPIPPATLRHVVDEFNKPELESCWTDDMALGWVYQYWNDPEREALDQKIADGGKIEPHEIASKTQMFTERYMVDWLLQNSLGPMWLATCRKHGWTAEAKAPGPDGQPSVLDALEARRVHWRMKRDAGEVELTDLMPLHTDAERRWAYYLAQPIPDDAVTTAPETIRDLKLLDPAVGSGHFLVVAFDLLLAQYREEARHRGEASDPRWSDKACVERILSHNLHGIDLDPRAIQIAAAALWLKARRAEPSARPERLNLVASDLRLGSLPDDDPALVELRREVERETGIPAELTDTIVHSLRGADYLGSLLKVDAAVEAALAEHEERLGREETTQGDLFEGFPQAKRAPISLTEARTSIQGRLEAFLSHHSQGEDLGLRLRGAQLARGVRFARLVREGSYDLVVANPPYQGSSKLKDSAYVDKHYPLGKADLYAAFLLRGLELVKPGGVSAMLTMRNWMFIKQYSDLREHLLEKFDLPALGDFDRGAFEDVPDEVVSVAVSVFRKSFWPGTSVALCPTPRDDRTRDSERTHRKRAATLCHAGRHEFTPASLKVVPEWPLVYWWSPRFLDEYAAQPKLGEVAETRFGLNSGNNRRFCRKLWEIPRSNVMSVRVDAPLPPVSRFVWHRYLKGSAGVSWFDPCDDLILWESNGLAVKLLAESLYGSHSRQIRSERYYHRGGVAFTMIGSQFTARCHRWRSVIDSMGSSAFSEDMPALVCVMNSSKARYVMESINPTVHFQLGDVQRIPFLPPSASQKIFSILDSAFGLHESARELSGEFARPGPSPWRHAQDWAQFAVDQAVSASVPSYDPEFDPEQDASHLSYALGVALGRFGPTGAGVLDPSHNDLSNALPAGLLFLDGTLDAGHLSDGLGHPAAVPLHEAWETYGPAIGTKRKGLREWLALDFFKDVHKGMYENRPIYWLLSSAKKTFVAWINIHRWNAKTLTVLLADHLQPALTRLEGELSDLRAARDGADAKAAKGAEKRVAKWQQSRQELLDFIASVKQCSEKGPPPTDAKCPERECDARYDPDLDDGVMINSAALWPLLEPQWKEPKKWWKELCLAKGKKDYDWSHLALRYWPTRVDGKCQADPSLGVAHGCFWRYHPERAWAWELRLQDEIGPEFRIDETPYRPGGRDLGDPGSDEHRAAWLAANPEQALAAIEKEALRRMGRGDDRKLVPEMRILEPGIWSALPQEVWDLELRLSTKQDAEFRLLAPDEPEARRAFESENPKLVKARAVFLAGLKPQATLFAASKGADSE